MRTFAVLFFVITTAFQSLASLPAAATTRHVAARRVPTRHAAKRHVAYRAAIRVAPADEYFGRLKMSILGIRNSLHDLALKLQYSPDKSEDVLGAASMVEDALKDWEHKYPADPWLAKNVFELTSLYARVHTAHGQDSAARTLRWLLARYGRTHYGTLARAQIRPQVGLR
jgi:hypothetical protein